MDKICPMRKNHLRCAHKCREQENRLFDHKTLIYIGLKDRVLFSVVPSMAPQTNELPNTCRMP